MLLLLLSVVVEVDRLIQRYMMPPVEKQETRCRLRNELAIQSAIKQAIGIYCLPLLAPTPAPRPPPPPSLLIYTLSAVQQCASVF